MLFLLLQVLVTNLDVESVTHLEPANFWIGPSAVSDVLKLTHFFPRKFCKEQYQWVFIRIHKYVVQT